MWVRSLKNTKKNKKELFPYHIDDEDRILNKSGKGRPTVKLVAWCKQQLESEGRELAQSVSSKSASGIGVMAGIALALAPVTAKYVTDLHNTNVSLSPISEMPAYISKLHRTL